MHITIPQWLGAVLVAAFVLLAPPARAADKDVLVFAAASLTDVLTEAASAYEAETGGKVTLSFAGSSTLARQIMAGSPADMFISADEAWMDEVQKRDLVDSLSRFDLVTNRLVLIAPKASDAKLAIMSRFDLVAALDGGRLAVADPDSVPAGRYAKEALSNLEVWADVEPHLARAENVRVALSYVARGEAPLGIVYQTDAMAEPRVRIVDAFPDRTHTLIAYPAALVKPSRPEAQAFLTYLRGEKARAIFAKAGFSPVD
jgi:molybdate transport system substrate-binding protein